MKILLLLILVTFTGMDTLQAQAIPSAQINSGLRDSLLKKFPGAKDISWSANGTGYTANFKTATNRDAKVNFDNSARWQRIEVAVLSDSLRPVVRQTINSQYPGSTVKSTLRVRVRPNGVTHEDTWDQVVLEKNGVRSTVKIDAQGRVLK